jgi:hypothetical protein
MPTELRKIMPIGPTSPRLPSARFGIGWAFFILAAIPALQGCSAIGSSKEVQFSPDGSLAAVAIARLWDLPTPPEPYTIRTDTYVAWRPLDNPSAGHSVGLGSYGREFGSFVVDAIHPVFSPDSKRLAVAGPSGLSVVDIASREQTMLSLPGELVTSFVWLGDEEIGYVAHSNRRGKWGNVSDRTFRRQNIRESADRSVAIFSQDGFRACPPRGVSSIEWPLESWSPNGRYVLFMDQIHGGRFHLMEVAGGTVTPIGSTGVNYNAVSWHPDESKVLCVNSTRKGRREVLLVHPATGEIVDLSEKFMEAFGRDFRSTPRIPRLWTADGRYVIVNELERGGCLVSPDPWAVIPVAKLFMGLFKEADGRPLFQADTQRLPWLSRQPAAGWVKVWVQLDAGGRPQGRDFAVNYEGTRYVPLGESHAPGGGWTITPDGRHVVVFAGAGVMTVQSIKLGADGP